MPPQRPAQCSDGGDRQAIPGGDKQRRIVGALQRVQDRGGGAGENPRDSAGKSRPDRRTPSKRTQSAREQRQRQQRNRSQADARIAADELRAPLHRWNEQKLDGRRDNQQGRGADKRDGRAARQGRRPRQPKRQDRSRRREQQHFDDLENEP